MDLSFHIDKIFEMAIQMEEEGAQFYHDAARFTEDKEVRGLLEKLSVMEGEHKTVFEKMRSEVAERSSMFDPSGEGALYLKSVDNSKVFSNKSIDTSSVKEVFKEAIWREKDTVVFYLGIRLAMTEESSRLKLDKIIEEEMSHVRILSDRVKQLDA